MKAKAIIEIDFELPKERNKNHGSEFEHMQLLCNVFAESARSVKCSAVNRQIKSVKLKTIDPIEVKD